MIFACKTKAEPLANNAYFKALFAYVCACVLACALINVPVYVCTR